MKVKIGKEYFHTETRGLYIVRAFPLVKIKGEWVEGVSYFDPQTKQEYTRTLKNFKNRFVKAK